MGNVPIWRNGRSLRNRHDQSAGTDPAGLRSPLTAVETSPDYHKTAAGTHHRGRPLALPAFSFPAVADAARLASRDRHDTDDLGSRRGQLKRLRHDHLSTLQQPPRKIWTVADLYRRFGPIPFERIRQNPPPGSGTVDDVIRLNDHEDRLYELVDGILVEKTVGLEESCIAVKIADAPQRSSSSREGWEW